MSRKQLNNDSNLKICMQKLTRNEHELGIPPTQTLHIPVARYHSLPGGNLGQSTSYHTVETTHGRAEPPDPNYSPFDSTISEITETPDISTLDPAYLQHLEETVVGPRQPRASDNPLRSWIPDRDTFVAEDVRWDGRGGYTDNVCPECKQHPAQYQCEECEGGRLLCRMCTLDSHRLNSLHRLKLWNGFFFEKTSLKALGLRIQLGHRSGESCSNPKTAFANDFVIVHINGIHNVSVDFCDCETAQLPFIQLLRYRWFPATVGNPKSAATFLVLKHFHILTFESKASCFEFYHTLTRLTDNTETEGTKDRYSAFLRMVREYRHIKMLKRSGRGHNPTGAAGTKPGECAVLCPACPQPDLNLPPGWEKASPGQRWIYSLFLAIDANFRLKRKQISNSTVDPALGDGMSYFVKRNEFVEFLNTHGKLIIQDPSTCSNHKAIDAEHSSKGLAATGVGTIDCARHDVKRPLSVGDLQVSERYVNMDFLFFSSLLGSALIEFVVSYDIVCQWSIKLWERMNKYPQHLRFGPDGVRHFVFLVPKFHLPAHVMACQTPFSFNFNAHVGRTDGEAPERGWSHINPVATSTREMGPGSRQDTLDDHFGDWNWKKTVLMGVSLLRKIQVAVAERSEHVFRYHQFENGLNEVHVEAWKTELNHWLKDHGKRNPFEPIYKSLTQNAVRLELAKQDAADLINGTAYVLHETVSASQLITLGLDLEDQQRRLIIESAELGMHSTDIQATRVQVKRNTLKRKIDAWISIQHLYVPPLSMIRTQSNREEADDLAEKTPLFLPSSMKPQIPCDPRLREIEWTLRKSQANDALDDLREGLRLRAYLYIDKDRFQRGQFHNTRSRGIIHRVQVKIDAAATRYRVARNTLYSLAGVLNIVGWDVEFPPLLDRDIKQLSGDDTESEGHRYVSWIWTRLGDSSRLDTDEALQDMLRIEWCKSKARADRWSEEVQLLLEEMQHVLQFFESMAERWERRVHAMVFLVKEQAINEGLTAYAARQASLFRMMRGHFQHMWRFVPRYVELGAVDFDVIPPELITNSTGE
ncbi:hypothetical protein BDZ94DRAFT_1259836 [Collybia nuda]|uniref:CxC2-like cysteine cluster KDZ transposase-associated domain-containing protein n=1 Tax=Collybia nuda TaxID=64659 RepID=A0A9P6CJP0_9AGAR|nr:hypothetical protein BDZ94DRAFT_1259836 [Collybia nuda]